MLKAGYFKEMSQAYRLPNNISPWFRKKLSKWRKERRKKLKVKLNQNRSKSKDASS